MTDIVLSNKLHKALSDCARHPLVEQGTFIFMPKHMTELEKIGLVREVVAHRNHTGHHRGKPAYAPTELGRAVLKFWGTP